MALLTLVWVFRMQPVNSCWTTCFPHLTWPHHVATGGGNLKTALYSTGSRLRSQNALGTVARTEAGERSVGLRRLRNYGAVFSHPGTGSPRGPAVSDSERSPPGTKTGLQLRLLLEQTGLRGSGALTVGCQTVPGTNQAISSELLSRGEGCGTRVADSH